MVKTQVRRLDSLSYQHNSDKSTVLSVVGPIATTAPAVRLLLKSILSQNPWLHDPLVIELPWRDDLEMETLKLIKASTAEKGQLAFGILENDGIVTPQPPVARAISIVAETLRRLGHKVIPWNPPSHDEINKIVLNSWAYDGGADIFSAFALSGEPPAPAITRSFGKAPTSQWDASRIHANNVAHREIKKRYVDYWNSTVELTGTDRPVDAFISPVAPGSAARRDKYSYYGYSTFVNGLDYTSVVVPITQVDKGVDTRYPEGYKPLTEQDKVVFEDCKSLFYNHY